MRVKADLSTAGLVLGEHTVHRYIADILGKLEVFSCTTAVASAARRIFEYEITNPS